MAQTLLPDSYSKSTALLDTLFAVPGNFGIIRRALCIGGEDAVLYFSEGLSDTAVTERVLAFCMEFCPDAMPDTAEEFCARNISFAETEISDNPSVLHAGVVTGCLLLLHSAYPTKAILIKSRNIPSRSPQEPEHDKVLRGAHIGFVELLQRNCAMLRRQLPTPSLMMKQFAIGTASRTNVVMCYLRGRADTSYLAYLEERLSALHTDNLCMGTQSLAECLVHTRVWNPFPRFRYTERPDAAAASLCEGSIVLLVDGAPQAMILPVSVFSFLQEAND
ncbi:MAG: spore germination protein, partial [Clostridia bacterium]|nr:spore germination protein [Clostridia bacterium]